MNEPLEQPEFSTSTITTADPTSQALFNESYELDNSSSTLNAPSKTAKDFAGVLVSADADGNNLISKDELKRAELTYRSKGDKYNERIANELQAEFKEIKNLVNDGGEDISLADQAALVRNWEAYKSEAKMLATLKGSNIDALFNKMGKNNATLEDLSKLDDQAFAAKAKEMKLTAAEAAQLKYLGKNVDQIKPSAGSAISKDDVTAFVLRRSMETPDIPGMESRLKDVVKTVVVPQKVYIKVPTRPSQDARDVRVSPGADARPLTGEAGSVGAAAAGKVDGKKKP